MRCRLPGNSRVAPYHMWWGVQGKKQAHTRKQSEANLKVGAGAKGKEAAMQWFVVPRHTPACACIPERVYGAEYAVVRTASADACRVSAPSVRDGEIRKKSRWFVARKC